MSSAINVPVKVRSHELTQVHEMVPEIEGRLRDAGLDDEADSIHRVYDEHISGVEIEPRESEAFAAYLSMPADDWRTLVAGLSRLRNYGLRSQWLQKKLVTRLRDRMEEME